MPPPPQKKKKKKIGNWLEFEIRQYCYCGRCVHQNTLFLPFMDSRSSIPSRKFCSRAVSTLAKCESNNLQYI